MKYVLASGSPRRKELMQRISNDFEILVPNVDERAIEEKLYKRFCVHDEDHGPMQDIACVVSMELALAKAKAAKEILVARGEKDFIIIGCDTSVALPNEILGKPKDRDDAVRMLRDECKDPQYVVSGVAFVSDSEELKFCEITKVIFNPLTEEQEAKIQAYCDTPEPYDKAGAYGIQLYGDGFVDRVEGDLNNVMGFPVNRIKRELEKFWGIKGCTKFC
ncbi:MAG: Maf family protein [Clostridia bacterium]|nr:Maf family protein [Clostridia bacterium]